MGINDQFCIEKISLMMAVFEEGCVDPGDKLVDDCSVPG